MTGTVCRMSIFGHIGVGVHTRVILCQIYCPRESFQNGCCTLWCCMETNSSLVVTWSFSSPANMLTPLILVQCWIIYKSELLIDVGFKCCGLQFPTWNTHRLNFLSTHYLLSYAAASGSCATWCTHRHAGFFLSLKVKMGQTGNVTVVRPQCSTYRFASSPEHWSCHACICVQNVHKTACIHDNGCLTSLVPG